MIATAAAAAAATRPAEPHANIYDLCCRCATLRRRRFEVATEQCYYSHKTEAVRPARVREHIIYSRRHLLGARTLAPSITQTDCRALIIDAGADAAVR